MISKTFLNPKKNPTNYIMFIVKVLITKYLDKYLYKNLLFLYLFLSDNIYIRTIEEVKNLRGFANHCLNYAYHC